MRFSGFFSGFLSVFLIVSIILQGSFFIFPQKSQASVMSLIKGIGGPETSSLLSCGATYGISYLIEKLKSLDSVPSTESFQASTFIKNNCLDPLAKAIATRLAVKMAEKTVNWINTGLDGNPFYIKELGTYVTSVEDQFMSEMNAYAQSQNGPFARKTAIGLINNYKKSRGSKNKWEDFVLGEIINGTWEDFLNKDFYTSGWNGWLAATLIPQNNPIGYAIMASDRTYEAMNTRTETTLKELAQNNGFLNLKICVKYKKEENGEYLKDENGKKICEQHESKTPGAAVKTAMDGLFKTDKPDMTQIDDPVMSLFTGIFLALSNTLIEKGLESGTTENNSFTNNQNSGFTLGFGSNSSITTNQNNSNWANAGVQTSIILEDLEKYYQNQNKYIDKINSLIQKIDELIPQIYKADFCVPGPRPDWYETAQQVIGELQGQIEPNQKAYIVSGFFQGVFGVRLDNIYLPFGDQWQDEKGKSAKIVLAGSLNGRVTESTNVYLPGYKDFIYQRFGPQNQIPSAGPIAQEYKEIGGYQIIKSFMEENKNKAYGFRSSIDFIKNLFNALPPKTSPDYISKREEIQKKANNLLSGMFRENDLDSIDLQKEEYEDKLNFVKNTLIPQCESQYPNATYQERKPYPQNLLPPGTNYPTTPTFLNGITTGGSNYQTTIMYMLDHFLVDTPASNTFLYEARIGIY